MHKRNIISDDKWKRTWFIDSENFIRNNNRVYVLEDPAIRIKILHINYDNLWQDNYTGRNRTIKTIERFY
jgi:hypothetical protein